jgi:hypothetical protein
VTDKDIIKQIIFKFKSEGEDKIKRTGDTLAKSISSKEIENYQKGLSNIQKMFSGSGNNTLAAGAERYGKILDEINKKQIKQMGQELEAVMKRADKIADRIDRARKAGMDTKYAEAAFVGTMGRATELQDNMPASEPAAPAAGSNTGGRRSNSSNSMLSIAGAMATSISAIADLKRSTIENRISVANTLKERQMSILNGDMTNAAVMSAPGAKDRVSKDSKSLNFWSNMKSGIAAPALSLISGAITASQLGTFAASGFAGAAGLAGAATLAAPLALAAGVGTAGYLGYKYWMGGGKEVGQSSNLKLAQQNEYSRSLRPELMGEFAKTADMRYQYQRQLGLGDESALGMRSVFRGAGVTDEGEMANMMMRFRRFGKPAAGLGANSAIQAQKYGMSGDIMSQFMGTTAAYNKSGPNSAMEEVAKAVEKGMERGIDNSGMMEVFQKQVDTTMELFKGRMDRGAAADVVGSYLSGPATARQLEALPQAMQGYANTIGGASGFEKTKKTAGLMALSHGDMDKFNLLSNLSDQQLADMPAAQLAEYAGVSPSEITQFKKDRIESTVSSVPGERGSALLKKLRSGKTLSPLEKRILATSGGNNIASWQPEAVDELMQKYKNGENIEGNYKAPGTDLSGTNTAANEAIKGKAIGGNIKDAQVHEEIGKNIKSIAGDFQNQASEVKKSLESGALAGSIEGIADATHEIVLALKGAATSIRNGTSSAPRAQPAKPGGTN